MVTLAMALFTSLSNAVSDRLTFSDGAKSMPASNPRSSSFLSAALARVVTGKTTNGR